MRLTDDQILIIQANRNLLIELTCATQTPNIPASIRQRAQKILSQYPSLPAIGEFSTSANSATSQLEIEEVSSHSLKENKTWRSSVTEFLSDAEKTKNACVYAGLVGSALAVGAAICIRC